MDQEEILVVWNADTAKTEIKVKGVKGAGCAALTSDLEADLGSKISDRRTSDYVAEANSQRASIRVSSKQ